MALRHDPRQHTIYDPDSCEMVMRVMESAALVMFGSWLQTIVSQVPHSSSDNVGRLGELLKEFGKTRQQINAGLSQTDVPDILVEAALAWDVIARWHNGDRQMHPDDVGVAASKLVDAMEYLHKRNMEHGTNHPRWTARLLTGTTCKECGR